MICEACEKTIKGRVSFTIDGCAMHPECYDMLAVPGNTGALMQHKLTQERELKTTAEDRQRFYACANLLDEPAPDIVRNLVEDINTLLSDRAALQQDIANAVKCAKEYCPDYPWTDNTASEAVWATGESLRGTEAANIGLHAELFRLSRPAPRPLLQLQLAADVLRQG